MMLERMQPVEAALLSHYDHLLVADPRQFALGRDDGGYVRIQKPFTPAVRLEMLRGRLTVALYCLTQDRKATQGVVDSDREDGLKDLQQVGLRLRDFGLQPLLEASARGGHLRIFHEPVDPAVTVGLLTHTLNQLHVTAEVFPRSLTGLSNIRAPLSRHPVTKKQYPFLSLDTLEPVAPTVHGNLAYLQGFTRASHQVMAEGLARAIAPPKPHYRPSEGHAQGWSGKPDLLAVVSSDRSVQKIGRNFRAVCPFHADKKRSLVLYTDTQKFHCFGCGAHGDSIDYLAKRQGISPAEVLRQLRQG